jgi:dihydrofolate reductase
MRKVIVSEMVSLEGYFARPDGSLDWHVVDDEFNTFARKQLDEMDTLLFGRVTYEGMASYWSTEAAMTDDPEIAAEMNSLPKIVFSRTLKTVDWSNSRLARGDLAEEIMRLKAQAGKDMVIFGSGEIVSTLTSLGLIDEYRLFVCPVVLGSGKSLFAGLSDTLNLELLGAQPFASGVVLLCYQPASNTPAAQAG